MDNARAHDLSLVWLRRDLRLEDNMALSRATENSRQVAVLFVFDTKILKALKSKQDMRVNFIYDALNELDQELRRLGSRLIVLFGDPVEVVPQLVKDLNVRSLYYNEDYEPYAKTRDHKVRKTIESLNVSCITSKDQVIFSGGEINKSDGEAYKMFTPYKNTWLKKLQAKDYSSHKVAKNNFCSEKYIRHTPRLPSLSQLGFERPQDYVGAFGRKSALKRLSGWAENLNLYKLNRDFPFLENGTSKLSVDLRFGSISIRECVQVCASRLNEGARVWLSELIWREFYQMILDRFPHVANSAFKSEYNNIKWVGKNEHFKAWCEGETGYPIVDAGMRQLNQTGWMHNRVRMITASFLVKDLLVDWRLGEKYFAQKLLDFDLASNNGGWQWCASTGCDSQPYFRIFNPVLQSQKFDSDCVYIKHWVPELRSLSPKKIHLLSLADEYDDINRDLIKGYPRPIVNHSLQKIKALKMYRAN